MSELIDRLRARIEQQRPSPMPQTPRFRSIGDDALALQVSPQGYFLVDPLIVEALAEILTILKAKETP